jgi:hypothetical protein
MECIIQLYKMVGTAKAFWNSCKYVSIIFNFTSWHSYEATTLCVISFLFILDVMSFFVPFSSLKPLAFWT